MLGEAPHVVEETDGLGFLRVFAEVVGDDAGQGGDTQRMLPFDFQERGQFSVLLEGADERGEPGAKLLALLGIFPDHGDAPPSAS